QAGVSAAWRRAAAVRGPRLRSLFPAAHGWRGARAQYAPCRRLLPRAPALAPFPADAQSHRHPLMAMELSYRFGFDAAHRFENYPEGHPYRGVHGHSFQAEVAVRGTPDSATGFVTDFGDLEKACAGVRAALDHRMLNELKGLERPSLENLSVWIWNRLKPDFPGLARVTVRRDSIGQSCSYTG